MLKVQKSTYIIFISILIQTLLGTSLGLAMLYFSSRNHIPANVYLGGEALGGLQQEKAAQRVEEKYRSLLANGSFVIEYGDSKNFEIRYKDIDGELDKQRTMELAFGSSRSDTFINLLKSYFSSERIDIAPVVTFSEGKLREKLDMLGKLIQKEPMDAHIDVKDRRVIKSPEANGLKFNLDNSVEKIRREIGSALGGKIYFTEDNAYELEAVPPEYTLKHIAGVDVVLAQYSTEIRDKDLRDSIAFAASAINRVVLRGAGAKGEEKAGVFSFNKQLSLVGGLKERNDEGYNQVASTLYGAVLNAGIDFRTIIRAPHSNAVEYIEPALDAMVLGETYDFKFRNIFYHPIMIFTELEENTLTVSILGQKSDREMGSRLETEIVQKYKPTVEYIENRNMEPGEKKLISPGKDGIKVKVYRVVSSKNGETERQYLYEDKYEATKAIVEIGPNTKWGEQATK